MFLLYLAVKIPPNVVEKQAITVRGTASKFIWTLGFGLSYLTVFVPIGISLLNSGSARARVSNGHIILLWKRAGCGAETQLPQSSALEETMVRASCAEILKGRLKVEV